MVEVDGTATKWQHTQRSRLYAWQCRLASLSWRMRLWLFIASGVSCFGITSSAVIATDVDHCAQSINSVISLPLIPSDRVPCPIERSEISQQDCVLPDLQQKGQPDNSAITSQSLWNTEPILIADAPALGELYSVANIISIQPQVKLDSLQLPLTAFKVRPLVAQTNTTELSEEDRNLGILRLRKLNLERSRSLQSQDRDLGELRLRELQREKTRLTPDPELGILRVRELELQGQQLATDPDLGILRVRELEETTPAGGQQPFKPQTTAQLLAQLGYFQTNNIFSGVDPVTGGLFSTGLTLVGSYSLAPRTSLIATIDGNLIRYTEQSEFNYNQFRVRAGIRHQLTPRVLGEVSWINQQLFKADSSERFLNENAIRFLLRRRDSLSDNLRLDTSYELRLNDANPESRSRVINSLGVSLNYNIQSNLQAGLDYQLSLTDFTERQREDRYQRLLARLTYALNRDHQISVQGGLTSGNSTDADIDFDNFFFSVTYTIELADF